MTSTSDLTPRKRLWSNIRWLMLGLVLGTVIGVLWAQYHHSEPARASTVSTASPEPMETYQVMTHDVSSGEWVIVAVNREVGRRVQITASCDFYKWGNRESVQGPTGCDLLVGQTLVPNRLGTRPGEFLDVWQLGDTLFITRGKGDDRIHQQFTVRSAKVLP